MQIVNSDKKAIGWLLADYNITERKIAEIIFGTQAYHDELTGFPIGNIYQPLFSEELAHAKIRGGLL
jgi:hypothetical protein